MVDWASTCAWHPSPDQGQDQGPDQGLLQPLLFRGEIQLAAPTGAGSRLGGGRTARSWLDKAAERFQAAEQESPSEPAPQDCAFCEVPRSMVHHWCYLTSGERLCRACFDGVKPDPASLLPQRMSRCRGCQVCRK